MRQDCPLASMNLTGIDRRLLLRGSIMALALAPVGRLPVARAQESTAAFVAAAKIEQGFAILLLSRDGTILRQVPLSARGHDIALHRPQGRAVAFARRPGTFAVAFSLKDEREPMIFNAQEGRHFYGHGAFSADGRVLYVSENDIAAGQGVIGLYDVAAGYRKIGEMPSFGVGPHELILLADGRTLAVANGGIDTVPEAGRSMLNLDEMKPNLAFVDVTTGTLRARHDLPEAINRLSIRHIAEDARGAVWFGGQWEGDVSATPELVGHASLDAPITLMSPRSPLGLALKGYIGSVAASGDGRLIAASAPKAGRILYLSAETGDVVAESPLADGCGVAGEAGAGFAVSSGLGVFRHEALANARTQEDRNGVEIPPPRLLDEHTLAGIAFDNHLRRI